MMASRFAKNSLLGVVSGVANALSNFGSSVILARLLGVDGLGTVMLALWIVVLGAAIADLGSATALSRYLPEFEASRQEDLAGRLTRHLFRPFAAGLLLLCLGLAGYGAWRWHLAGTVAPALGPDRLREAPAFWFATATALLLQGVSLFGYGYLRGVQRFEAIARLTIVSLAVQLVAVAIGSLAWGPVGALAGYCAGFLIPAVATLRHLGRGGPIDPALKRRVRRYAAFAWAGNLATAVLYSRVELFFLERSWGTGAVGLFAIGITLANIAAQGPMLLTSGLLPHFSESFGRGDRAAIQRLYTSGTRVMAFLVFPACFGLAAILPSLIPLVYGAQFDRAIDASMILALSSAGGVVYVGSQLALGCDRSDLGFIGTLAGAALLLAGCLLVIPGYGIMGAALVRTGVQIILVVVNLWLIRSRLGYVAPVGHMLRLLAASAICGASAWVATRALPAPVNLAVAVPLGVVVYGVCVRLLDALPGEDVDRLRGLFRRLPGPILRPTDRAFALLSRHAAGGTAAGAVPGSAS